MRLTDVSPRWLQSAIVSTTPQSGPAGAGADSAPMPRDPAAPLPVGTAGRQRLLIAGYPAVSFQARARPGCLCRCAVNPTLPAR